MKSQHILLGVNIDHSATVRQARYRTHPRDCGQMVEPDPVAIALLAERAGADAITLHLREDRRHIQDSDVYRMREAIHTPMNLEMAATEAMLKIATTVKPDVVLLVPESREEVTTEGGLDILNNKQRVREMIEALQPLGIETSLFIDPDPAQIDAAAAVGAQYVELHTGTYANAFYQSRQHKIQELTKLEHGAIQAHEAGLKVNAGHGINYVNIKEVITIPWLHELNIGHSIMSRAIATGIDEAVREMKSRIVIS